MKITMLILAAMTALPTLMPTIAQAEPLPLPPEKCLGKDPWMWPECEKRMTAPSSECTACLYGCYPTSDGGTRCAYPPPEVGDFPIGAAKAEASGHTCSLIEIDDVVVGDCEVYDWHCEGGECEDTNGARWGDPGFVDPDEPTMAECKPVEIDTDGFAGAVICYGDTEAWTCSSNDGAEWFCWATDVQWSTDCPSCGSPVAEIERLANIDPDSTLPSGCSWSPGYLEGECRYSCNGWLKAACRVTYDGSSTVCRQSDGQTSVHKGQVTC